MNPVDFKPHDIAAAEIEGWRGRCLNFFARGEHTVAAALASARAKDPAVRIQHLAGQRLAELQRIGQIATGTEKQKAALAKALSDWRACDEHRPCFSHGVMTVLLDRTGEWHVQFDMTAWQSSLARPIRLTWSKVEAFEFEKRLTECFNSLSGQLGQFRKSLN